MGSSASDRRILSGERGGRQRGPSPTVAAAGAGPPEKKASMRWRPLAPALAPLRQPSSLCGSQPFPTLSLPCLRPTSPVRPRPLELGEKALTSGSQARGRPSRQALVLCRVAEEEVEGRGGGRGALFHTNASGAVAAARPATARAASLVVGICGGPHSAALLLRTLRRPAWPHASARLLASDSGSHRDHFM
jgi:hypothetical protein